MIQKVNTPSGDDEDAAADATTSADAEQAATPTPDDAPPAGPAETEPLDAAGPELPERGPTSDSRPLEHRLEAVLFASGQALSAARLAKVLEADVEAVKAALEALVQAWAERPGAIELVAISAGYRFMTRPDFGDDLAGLARKGGIEHLSPAALETLAVVAYRQPIGRAQIESVRGVRCGPLLRVLLDRDLIRVTGRSPEPGHPLLYGTTKRFLDHFGLKTLKELPDIKDLLDVS